MRVGLTGTLALLITLGPSLSCSGLIQAGLIVDISERYRAGDCAGVLKSVDESIAFISNRPELLAEVYLFKAKCLQRMSREGEAVEIYRYVTEQHPTTASAYEARALLSELEPSEP